MARAPATNQAKVQHVLDEIKTHLSQGQQAACLNSTEVLNTDACTLTQFTTGAKQSVDVECIDVIECTRALCSRFSRVLVVSFASDIKPGGGWRGRGTLQEETICHNTNLGLLLEAKKDLYPLTEKTCIYTPDVYVFGQTPPQKCSVLTIAAPRRPTLTATGEYASQSVYEQMIAKIRSMFYVAKRYRHDAIILGAFGCGAFGNPSSLVARLFRDMIHQYACDRIKIVFAVLGMDNFPIFRNVLAPVEKRIPGAPPSLTVHSAKASTPSAAERALVPAAAPSTASPAASSAAASAKPAAPTSAPSSAASAPSSAASASRAARAPARPKPADSTVDLPVTTESASAKPTDTRKAKKG